MPFEPEDDDGEIVSQVQDAVRDALEEHREKTGSHRIVRVRASSGERPNWATIVLTALGALGAGGGGVHAYHHFAEDKPPEVIAYQVGEHEKRITRLEEAQITADRAIAILANEATKERKR